MARPFFGRHGIPGIFVFERGNGTVVNPCGFRNCLHPITGFPLYLHITSMHPAGLSHGMLGSALPIIVLVIFCLLLDVSGKICRTITQVYNSAFSLILLNTMKDRRFHQLLFRRTSCMVITHSLLFIGKRIENKNIIDKTPQRDYTKSILTHEYYPLIVRYLVEKPT